jgi:protein-disulfide isomerase
MRLLFISTHRWLVGAIALALLVDHSAIGQSDARADDPLGAARNTEPEPTCSDLEDQIRSVRADLAQIKTLLEHERVLPNLASGTVTNSAHDSTVTLPFVPRQSLGKVDAPTAVIEFNDLQCPFCAYFQAKTFPQFKSKYIDSGKVRFFSVDFPLPSHPDASKLALGALCAGEQNHYWEMRDLLLAQKTAIADDLLNASAAQLGLDTGRFKFCMSSGTMLDEIKETSGTSARAGVSGTPTFLIGKVTDKGVVGKLIVGALSPEEFDSRVDEVIADAAAKRAGPVAEADTH